MDGEKPWTTGRLLPLWLLLVRSIVTSNTETTAMRMERFREDDIIISITMVAITIVGLLMLVKQ